MVPLHLLATELPVIPIIVNCLAGLPAPLHRCHALGVALRRTVERWPERVAVLGTGGLSHWPAMPESGRIGIDFDQRFLEAFLGGRIETFLRYSREQAGGGGRAGGPRDPHLDRGGRQPPATAVARCWPISPCRPGPPGARSRRWSLARAAVARRECSRHARPSRRIACARPDRPALMGPFGIGQAVRRFEDAAAASRAGAGSRATSPARRAPRHRAPLDARPRAHSGHRRVGGAPGSRGRRGLHGPGPGGGRARHDADDPAAHSARRLADVRAGPSRSSSATGCDASAIPSPSWSPRRWRRPRTRPS